MQAFERAMRGEQFIAGAWTASDERIDVVDPGLGRAFAAVASASADQCIEAVAAADAAAQAWAATAPRQRAECLRKAFELIMEQADDFARLITLESGKALADSMAEVRYGAEFFRWFSEEACRAYGSHSIAPSGGYRILTSLQPVGVSLLVTPWNFPLAMGTRKIGAALAAGCTVVLKPAKETPLTSLVLAAVLEQAGVPAGVVNVVVTASSSVAVPRMMTDGRVRKLSFTGSTSVGKHLLALASERVLRTSMELGGNAPFIVCADADLDVAVEAAMLAKLRNGGQACTAANRFIVHASVEAEFSARFAQAMESVGVGYGLNPGVGVGALITASEREGMLGLIADADGRGADVACGGKSIDGPGFFLQPTLLRNVTPECRCFVEEIFGPVAPVTTFDTVDEAVALANAVDVGLVSYVMSQNQRLALSIAERLESGMVGVNRGVVSDPAAPFGGWKESGLGREGGHEGLLEYLETKYVAVSW